MDEQPLPPKVTNSLTLKGKRILLESAGDHRMWVDVLQTGELVLHEMFGVPADNPTTLEEYTLQENSCYHVTICIKPKYVGALMDFFKRDDLFSFDESPAAETKDGTSPD